MQLKRVIIAISLLFTYGVSLAHSVIPHCHHGFEVSTADHEHAVAHEHHDSVEQIPQTEDPANHINHQGHYDESLLDLILCLFSDSDHPDNFGEDAFIPSSNAPVQLKSLNQASLLVSLIIAINAEECAEERIIPQLKVNYTAPELFTSGLRGPPAIS
ncbi:MAG: hypothetical protein R2813_01315 [Flavobacteriales bacterium]